MVIRPGRETENSFLHSSLPLTFVERLLDQVLRFVKRFGYVDGEVPFAHEIPHKDRHHEVIHLCAPSRPEPYKPVHPKNHKPMAFKPKAICDIVMVNCIDRKPLP